MISQISKFSFINKLNSWKTDVWYYNTSVIDAAETIAVKKGYKIAYYEIEKNNKIVALLPLKYKKKNFFFSYSELLISKDLGIDNIELLIDWNQVDENIFYSLAKIFSKTELHHLKIVNKLIDSKLISSNRKVLFLETENHEIDFSKNFKQNIRTAKNRIEKNDSYNFSLINSENINFINEFESFTTNHINSKTTTSWKDDFFKQLLNKTQSNVNAKFIIYKLEINNKTVAGIFGWVKNNVFYFNQSYYFKEYSQYSPIILIIDDFCKNKHLIKEIKIFDFMRGTEKYKSNFTKKYYKVCNLEIRSSSYNLFFKLFKLVSLKWLKQKPQ